jgi:hypothetical protein
MKPSYRLAFIQRRSELMAELFLQQLDPLVLARPTNDLGFDFLITFKNRKGGTNTFGVQVKGTESEVSHLFSIDKSLYRRLTLSNIPVFLLVADVKRNVLYFGWPSRKHQQIKLGEINDETTHQLKQQLIKWIPKLSEV